MNGRPRFDPRTGWLRLTPDAVRAVAQLASTGADPEPSIVEELRAGGLVVDGGLHERLVPLGRCFASPLTRVALEQLAPAGSRVDGWIDDKIAVLLRSTGDAGQGGGEVVAIPRGMIALNLARLVELGPRSRVKVGASVEIDDGLLEALLSPGEGWTPEAIESMCRREDGILPEWLEILADLSNTPKRRWRVGAWWNSTEESPAARLLEVVEGEVGSFLLTHRREPGYRYRRVRLHPLSSTQMWRLLCALVPAPEQVETPLPH